MDILTGLPVWVQLLLAFLVAGVLIVMNIGWLMQARGWLDRQRQRQAGPARTPAGQSARQKPSGSTPPARPDREDI